MTPKVSVIIPTYNTAPYLRQAIESVLGQTFRDFELIIVDDGSTDGSSDIIERYRKTDSRIVVIRNELNKGTAYSLNLGHAAAHADLIAIMGSDDICLPARLEREVAFLNTHPDIALVGSFLDLIDDQGRFIRRMEKPCGTDRIRKNVFFYGPHAHNTVMYHKSAYDRVGGYDEKYTYCQDVNFYFCMIYSGFHTDNIPEVLVQYRVHVRSTLPYHRKKAGLNLELKREAIKRFNLKLTLAERASMYIHYLLDMLLTGQQKQAVEAVVKKLFFRS